VLEQEVINAPGSEILMSLDACWKFLDSNSIWQ